jgi:hypothetical protein
MASWMNNARLWRWVTIAVSFIWLFSLYSNILLHPDDHMFSASGDGIKNYFTFAYHVKHDANWLEFGGSNYPYHEHVGYTDGHPLFSLLLGWIPLIKNHPVGFLNLFMLLSIALTSLILYELLRLLQVMPSIAFVGALCINWLNPQIFRLEGHLALSYTWVIPIGLLLIHQFYHKRTWKFVFYYITFAIAVWFIHPYLAMALSLMAFSFMFFELLVLLYKKQRLFGSSIQWLVMAFMPIVFYLLFMKFTDTHTERAPDAKGYLQYSSSYECLFVPHHKPLKHLMEQIIKVHSQSWEGWSYIGIATMLIVLSSIVIFNKKLITFFKEHSFWVIAILGATAITLFACGFPFKQGLQSWLDIIPYIEQFRSPGRFAWVLYYTITIFAFVLLNHWILHWIRGKIILKISLLFICGMLFFLEGYEGQKEVANIISKSSNRFNLQQVDEITQSCLNELNECPEKQLAILPIPFFHYGSDYYSLVGTENSKGTIYGIAYLTGIPIMASGNPRVSLAECREMMNMQGHNYFEKKIWTDIPNDHLIYLLKAEPPVLKADSLLYMRQSNWIRMSELKNEFLQFQSNLYKQESFSNQPEIIFEEFDASNSGRMKGNTKNFESIYRIDSNRLRSRKNWTVSLWLYFSDPDALTTAVRIEKVRNDSVFWISGMHAATGHNQFRDSCFIEFDFMVEADYDYHVFAKGSDHDWAEVEFDHLMIRPTDSIYVQEYFVNKRRHLKYNNFPIVPLN